MLGVMLVREICGTVCPEKRGLSSALMVRTVAAVPLKSNSTHSYVHMNMEQPSYVTMPLIRSTSLNDTFSGSALTKTERDDADKVSD